MDAGSDLSEKSWAYDRLLRLWLGARAVIAETPEHLGIDHYSVGADDSDEACLEFSLYGAECYVAFTHDLESGALEYGVRDPLSDPRRRIRVSELRFDQQGGLGENHTLRDKRMTRQAHFAMLDDKASALVGAYFAAWRGETTP